jgi:hypothetical protein
MAGNRHPYRIPVGRHNADRLEALVELVEALGFRVIFQPAGNSLFLLSQKYLLARLFWNIHVSRTFCTRRRFWRKP